MGKPKILYVDDEIMNLNIFQMNLGKKYHVITAENGELGLNLIAENPDILIIISDMKMPKMNGLEFISKAKEQYPFIHFYILTGFEITPEIQQAINNGLILKCFRKPFNIKEIDLVIANAIGSG